MGMAPLPDWHDALDRLVDAVGAAWSPADRVPAASTGPGATP